MAEIINIGVAGAAGRMGRRIIALAQASGRFTVTAALDRAGSEHAGKDAGVLAGAEPIGVKIAATLDTAPQVLIDFSAPQATGRLIDVCREQRIGMVIGTTGLTAAEHQYIDRAAADIAILQATNTSLGVHVLLAAAARIARELGPEYDIEVVETHHRHKKDAPSGTAKSIVEAICAATGRSPAEHVAHGRHGAAALREPKSIGVHSLRMGDVVGEHTVYFATEGERVSVGHVATTRDTFAHGALRAAEFISRQRPGRYGMAQVLGLEH